MKTCSYCGREYSDEAAVCAIDQNPLVISKPKPSIPTIETTPLAKKFRSISWPSILPIGGFTILAGLFGSGLAWLVTGLYAKMVFNTVEEQLDFAGKSMPFMIAGGIIGLIVGFFVSASVARADPKTEEEIERKYVGPGGRGRIYFGAPLFVMALLAQHFERLLDKVGARTGVYVALGICLVIFAVSLVLYDRIPPKLVVPIGIIGWLLTLSLILWLSFFRSKAF
jgi:hypothetical protein